MIVFTRISWIALASCLVACGNGESGEAGAKPDGGADGADADAGGTDAEAGVSDSGGEGQDATSEGGDDGGPDGTLSSVACTPPPSVCFVNCGSLLQSVHSGTCTVPPCLDISAATADVAQELQTCCSSKCASPCLGCPFQGLQASSECAKCLELSCTQEVANCTADQRVACNPVTGKPCATWAGAACDVAWPDQAFVCWGGPNPQGECEPCKYYGSGYKGDYPKFCAPGLTCVDASGQPTKSTGTCRRYCCSDTDCSGKCMLGGFPWAPEVGLCVATCTSPETAPSAGTCAAH